MKNLKAIVTSNNFPILASLIAALIVLPFTVYLVTVGGTLVSVQADTCVFQGYAGGTAVFNCGEGSRYWLVGGGKVTGWRSGGEGVYVPPSLTTRAPDPSERAAGIPKPSTYCQNYWYFDPVLTSPVCQEKDFCLPEDREMMNAVRFFSAQEDCERSLEWVLSQPTRAPISITPQFQLQP